MDQVYHRACALSGFPPVGGELVGTCGCPVHIRRLHIEKDKMAVVERVAHARSAVHNVVGRRDSVCPRGRIFHQPVLLPELCHTVELARKVAPYRRLSLRQQGQLRPEGAAYAAYHAAHAAYPASAPMQVVYRVAAMGVPPRERIGQGGA